MNEDAGAAPVPSRPVCAGRERSHRSRPGGRFHRRPPGCRTGHPARRGDRQDRPGRRSAGVNLSSGSSTRLPVIAIWVSPLMMLSSVLAGIARERLARVQVGWSEVFTLLRTLRAVALTAAKRTGPRAVAPILLPKSDSPTSRQGTESASSPPSSTTHDSEEWVVDLSLTGKAPALMGARQPALAGAGGHGL